MKNVKGKSLLFSCLKAVVFLVGGFYLEALSYRLPDNFVVFEGGMLFVVGFLSFLFSEYEFGRAIRLWSVGFAK